MGLSRKFSQLVSYAIQFPFYMWKSKSSETSCQLPRVFNEVTKEAMQSSSVLRELIMILASPSTITSWRPSSCANKITFLPARASTSSTDGGKAILSDSAPMTPPSWSLITTPRLAAPSSWKWPHRSWLCTRKLGEETSGQVLKAGVELRAIHWPVGIPGGAQWHQHGSMNGAARANQFE